MKYRIDALSLRDGTLMIEGWAYGANKNKVKCQVTDRGGAPVKFTAVERDRADVYQQFGADRMCGITVAVPFERGDDVFLVLTDGPEVRKIRINESVIEKKNSIKAKRSEKLLALCHLETLRVAWDFYQENGLKALWKKSVHKIRKIDEDYDYPEWELKTRISEAEIKAQRKECESFAGKPLISVVIPAYNTGEQYLRMLFDSLNAQVYDRLEVIVADGSEGSSSVRKVTKEYAAVQHGADSFPYGCLTPESTKTAGKTSGKTVGIASDKDSEKISEKVSEKVSEKISELKESGIVYKYLDLQGNRGIAGNTNAGLQAATGDYIALCDHDDELPPSAIFYVVKAINENPQARFIYTDEDKIDFDGKAVFEPHFKSDYNPELLTSVNYICHLSVIRRDLLEKVGGFDPAFDGAQDHDFFLRICEEATREESGKLECYRTGLAELGDRLFGLHKLKSGEKAEPIEGKNPGKITGTTDKVILPGAADKGGKTGTKQEEVKLGEDRDITATPENVAYLTAKTGFSEKAVTELLEGRFTSEAIVHVPKICYHWRYHKGSTAENPASKMYAFEAGARAVKAHHDREGFACSGVEKGVTYGYYHTRFDGQAGRALNDSARLSIIIPNKDHIDDLDKCIRSICEKSGFRNIEFIVVENNSTKEETFDYYRNIENNMAQEGTAVKFGDRFRGLTTCPQISQPVPDASPVVKVVTWEREFNYSAINNFGERFATGDLILLLNNDVEIIGSDAITEMAAYAMKPEVGAVGARLNYGDDTIQHAGVIVGLGGIAGAAFVGLHEKENSYMHRMMCVQDYSAVTAACLMMRREVFEEVGGLREALAVAFNDIDLCMKVRAHGYRVVYDAYSTWHHYESKSRGLEDTPEKVMRFNGEIATFASHWDAILKKGDP